MKAGNVSLINFLLKRGADPNVADNVSQTTPMHLASERDMLSTVQLFMGTREGEPEEQDARGFTCLHIAAANGFLNLAMFLRTFTPEIERILDNDLHTASYWANHNGHTEVAAILP